MVADTSDPGDQSFTRLRSLCHIRDCIDLASGYCMNNLEVLTSIEYGIQTSQGCMDTVSAIRSLVQGHVRSLKLLKDRTDSTVQLVRQTRTPPSF